jgi:hypothetical protein
MELIIARTYGYNIATAFASNFLSHFSPSIILNFPAILLNVTFSFSNLIDFQSNKKKAPHRIILRILRQIIPGSAFCGIISIVVMKQDSRPTLRKSVCCPDTSHSH